MKTINGVIDQNDLAHVLRQGLKPTYASPAPMRKGKINPHVTAFLLEDGQVTEVFHVKPIYYLNKNGRWYPMAEIASFHGNKRIDLLPDWDQKMDLSYLRWLMRRMELIKGEIRLPLNVWHDPVRVREGLEMAFATASFFPDPSPETTSVDGTCLSVDETGTWSTAHDLATSNQANDDQTEISHRADTASGQFRLYRGFILFDTSSLPDAAVISAATVSLYGSTINDGQTDSLGVVQSSPASNTAVTTADFDAFTAVHVQTSAAEVLLSAFSMGSYNVLNLNATGIGWISTTGITKLGTRMKKDYTETTSHLNAPGSSPNSVTYFSSDQGGTSQDPTLTVTYTAGGGNVVQPSPGGGVAVGGSLMF